MNIEFDKIEEVLLNLNTIAIKLYNSLDSLEGLSAIIPKGRYRGRYGRLGAIHIDINKSFFPEIRVVIYPYNLKARNGSTLHEDIDARRYWNFRDFKDTITDKSIEELI